MNDEYSQLVLMIIRGWYERFHTINDFTFDLIIIIVVFSLMDNIIHNVV